MNFLSKEWREMTIDELKASYEYWNAKVEGYTSWGAGLVVANSYRNSAKRELQRRGIQIPL